MNAPAWRQARRCRRRWCVSRVWLLLTVVALWALLRAI